MEYPVIENGYLHVSILKKGDAGTISFKVPYLVKHENRKSRLLKILMGRSCN